MNNKIKVLIFPAGSEIAFEIRNSLRYSHHIELFGMSGKADNARLVYDQNHYLEGNYYVNDENFINKFNQILVNWGIDVIIPTHDTIALYLAQHRNLFSAKILTSSYETALIAREKKLTYNLFSSYNFCPKIYNPLIEDIPFPAFLKPNIGEGAKRTLLVNNLESLLFAKKENPDLLICEYLPGEELSVDCFTNRYGKLLFIGPRTRERVQMGISFRSISIEVSPEIKTIAETINEKVKIRGAWFFQIKKDIYGKYKLLEFAVRQASTMGLYRQLGVNFALLSVFDSMDMDVSILRNNYNLELERSLCNCYKLDLKYECVYIDFDDTIIVENTVNDLAIRFLYQCQKMHIKVILLTKHKFDIYESLNNYLIHKDLFDEIVVLKEDEEKVKYIKYKNAIFIDNYFFDRQKVFLERQIPVYDVDAIESLMILN
jgi:hypothetical protein